MKILRDEGGNVLVLTALGMTMLLSLLAISIDVGNLFFTQRQLQELADSAAMAAALEVSACSGTSHCGVMTTAATTALTEGGSATPTLFTQCAAASGTGLLLTINNGPCALGSSDPNNGNTNYVEAVVAEQEPTFFARIFGVNTVGISARAEAGKATTAGACLILTGTSGQTLTLNSGASITDASGTTCGVQVNSSASSGCSGPAVMENSGATVNLGSYNVHGNVCNNGGSYTPTPTTGASTVSDPYASLTAPSQPSASTTNSGTVSGTTELKPGSYGSLNFNGSGYTVTLDSGLYYFTGSVNIGGVTLSGSGVTIYMASGSLTMNSAATVSLSAPTSALSNCSSCSGMLIWQASNNSSQMLLDSGSSASWGGAIYVPDAQLTLNGGSTAAAYGKVVAQSCILESALSLGNGSTSSNGSSAVALAE